MLSTKIKECTEATNFDNLKDTKGNIMVTCGRMGPMCIPVYGVMEEIEKDYEDVAFRVIDFDSQMANAIKSLPEVQSFSSLPFVLYFKDGKVARATAGIQNKSQVTSNLNDVFNA
jgi:thioredoxin 1